MGSQLGPGQSARLVRMDGTDGDLSRFASAVIKGGAWESPSPQERRLSWNTLGYVGHVSVATLRSGVVLSTHSYRGEAPFQLAIDHAPTVLGFCISRGLGTSAILDSGEELLTRGSGLHVSQINRNVRIHCTADGGAYEDNVRISVPKAVLQDLLGTPLMPDAVQRVSSSSTPLGTFERRLTPELTRLSDEILNCDARGSSRQLHLEGRTLHLLGAIIDQLSSDDELGAAHVTASDAERLERARTYLLGHMDAPPTLAHLARVAGLNEAKLKAGFRVLFGASVFGYLRAQRMDRARILLKTRDHNVTEVARLVGYSNPSKFAAAFRRQFGVSPSAVA